MRARVETCMEEMTDERGFVCRCADGAAARFAAAPETKQTLADGSRGVPGNHSHAVQLYLPDLRARG